MQDDSLRDRLRLILKQSSDPKYSESSNFNNRVNFNLYANITTEEEVQSKLIKRILRPSTTTEQDKLMKQERQDDIISLIYLRSIMQVVILNPVKKSNKQQENGTRSKQYKELDEVRGKTISLSRFIT